MGNKRRILLLSLLILLAGVVGWIVFRKGEPVYQGRPLNSWLKQERESGGFDPEAESAIRAMGTDALPTLLKMLGTKDTAFRRGLTRLSENYDWFPYRPRPREELLEMGMVGFIGLGPIAKPAVPALIRFLGNDDPEIRSYAAYCLAMIGPAAQAAIPALTNYLGSTLKTNTGRFGEQEIDAAAFALGEMGPPALRAVPQLTALVTNPGFFAGAPAEAALIKIRGDSLEPLIERLKDTSNLTNWNRAAYVIFFLRTNAEPAIPVLINLLQRTNEHIQNMARGALHEIHARPDLCIPALTPFLQSTNQWTRLGAIDVSRRFGVTSNHLGVPEIIKLLNDPDLEVRAKAERALKQIDPAAAARAGLK